MDTTHNGSGHARTANSAELLATTAGPKRDFTRRRKDETSLPKPARTRTSGKDSKAPAAAHVEDNKLSTVDFTQQVVAGNPELKRKAVIVDEGSRRMPKVEMI